MIGSKVVCRDVGHHSDMLEEGAVYTVIGVRDAGLCPPKDPINPNEIKIIPGSSERAKLGWWYQFERFELAKQESTMLVVGYECGCKGEYETLANSPDVCPIHSKPAKSFHVLATLPGPSEPRASVVIREEND